MVPVFTGSAAWRTLMRWFGFPVLYHDRSLFLDDDGRPRALWRPQ
jgi:hypothetical protein